MSLDLEKIYNKYAPVVYRRCLQILQNPELAEDAMQDCFVNLLKRQEQIQDQYMGSLLFRIATNVSLNHIRNKKKQAGGSQLSLLESIASYSDNESRTNADDLIDRIFENEPASTKTIAMMHFIDGMTLAEVAQAVSLSVSGVRKRINQLKKHLEENKTMYQEVFYD